MGSLSSDIISLQSCFDFVGQAATTPVMQPVGQPEMTRVCSPSWAMTEEELIPEVSIEVSRGTNCS